MPPNLTVALAHIVAERYGFSEAMDGRFVHTHIPPFIQGGELHIPCSCHGEIKAVVLMPSMAAVDFGEPVTVVPIFLNGMLGQPIEIEDPNVEGLLWAGRCEKCRTVYFDWNAKVPG